MDEKDEFRRFTSKYKAEKIKSRNLSEKKRRDQFNMLINELCAMVTSSNRKMDKSSVLRSTISFLKNHSELSVQSQSVKLPENWKPSFLSNEEFTHLMLEALDGFIIVFSCNGQILYTSESTASLLGYLPSRIYSSIFDIIHEMDKSALYKLISSPPSDPLSKDSFMRISLHMKRGPIHPQGSSTYELVNLLGSFYHWPTSCDANPSGSFDCDSNSCSSINSLPSPTAEPRSCFVAVGRLQTPHLLRSVDIPEDDKNEFTSRHSLEWKFLFLDQRAPPIIGYLPFEVLGTSGYDYYHVDDLENIASSHEMLMNTGEGTSCFYRFLTKGQQWIWLQTRYYISYHQWNSKPEFIVCTHTVVSTEKVIKSLQDTNKALAKKPGKKAALLSTSPSQSACLSPSPSVSSHGSFSSEASEQSKVSPNPSSVLYTSPPTFPRSQFGDILPVPTDSFIEPHPHMSTHTQQSHSSPLSSPGTSMVQSPPYQDLQVHASPTNAATVSSPLMRRSSEMNMQQPDQHSPTQMSPHLNPDHLRHRYLFLQQQILAHKEELRQVSEQLMLVEFSNPSSLNMSGDPYQPQGMAQPPYQPSNVAEKPYQPSSVAEKSYQTARNMPQDEGLSENFIMRSLQDFTAGTSTPSFSGATSFFNLEPTDLCDLTTNQITQESGEVVDQNYTMNQQRPPNT